MIPTKKPIRNFIVNVLELTNLMLFLRQMSNSKIILRWVSESITIDSGEEGNVGMHVGDIKGYSIEL